MEYIFGVIVVVNPTLFFWTTSSECISRRSKLLEPLHNWIMADGIVQKRNESFKNNTSSSATTTIPTCSSWASNILHHLNDVNVIMTLLWKISYSIKCSKLTCLLILWIDGKLNAISNTYVTVLSPLNRTDI